MLNRTQRKQQCLASIVTKLLAQAIETMAKYPLIKTTTVALEIFILVFLIMQPNLASFSWATSIHNLIGGGSQSIVVFWVYNGGIIGMLVVLMVLVFKPVSNNIRRWLIISYIFLQVTCLLYQVNAVAIFTRNIVIFPLSLYILFLPISLFFLDVQLDHHLFGQLSIPLVAAEALLPFQIWKAAVLIFTIRFFFKAKNIHQKFGYIALGLVQLWAFCYPKVSSEHALQLLYPFLTLTIALSATIYLRESLMAEEKHSYLLGLVHKAKSKNKNPNEDLQLSMKQKIRIIEIVESSKIKHSADIFLNIDGLEDAILSGKAKITDVLKLLGCISDYADQKWVRAQIQIHKNTNILKIFKLIGQINPDGIDQTIRLQSLKIKAQNSTQLKTVDSIDVKMVQQVNISLECFYEHLYCCVKGLISFWRAVQGPSIKASAIAATLQQVLLRKQKAQTYLEGIKRVYPCKPERKLLKKIERLINNYCQQTTALQKSMLSNSSSKCPSNYMVIEERQIKEISSKLLVDLDLTSQSKFTLKEEDIVPSRLIGIIYEQYQSYTKQEFYLPLVVKSKLIVKRATIHLIPSYTSTLQHLIVVESLQIQQAFLYDARNDQILYFTRKIQVQTLENNKSDIIRSIPTAIFNLEFNQDNMQTLKKGNHLFCQLNRHFQRCFFPGADTSNQTSKVSLHLLAEYQSKKCHFLLIQMKPTTAVASFGTKVTAKARNIRQDSMDKSDKLKLYENQTMFCRIKNPYSENIREKIENHKRNKSFSNVCILSLLACLVLGVCIAILILVTVLSEGRRDNYLVFLEEGQKLNMEYQNLMKLYYDSHLRYFTKTCSDKVLQWRPDFNIESSLSYYTTSINSTIRSIMVEEFANPLQSQKPELNYSFKYGLFNISATTQSNDIVGLLQETKKYLTTGNITFLVTNYDQIRQIQNAYRISSIVSNKISQHPSNSYLVVQLGLPIIAILTVLIYIVLAYTKQVIDRIYSYIPKITSSQQGEALGKIDQIIRNHPILLHFDSRQEQTCIESVENRKDDSQSMIGGAQTAKRMESEHIKLFFMKNYVFGLLLLIITIAGVSYLSYINYQTNNMGQVMNYMQKMQGSSDFVLTEITDALNAIIWKYTFNTTNIYGVTDTFTIKTHIDFPLPSYFNSYMQLETQILYKDLCLTSDRVSPIQYFEGVNCSKIFDGTLQKGYSIVYENYRNGLTSLREVPLQNLLVVRRSTAEYPLLIQAAYSRRLITELIGDLIIQFVSTSKEYCNYLLNLITTYVQITFILLFLITLEMALAIYRLRKQCQLALDLLRIIPKDTLGDIKLTKQMIKSQFLASLERL